MSTPTPLIEPISLLESIDELLGIGAPHQTMMASLLIVPLEGLRAAAPPSVQLYIDEALIRLRLAASGIEGVEYLHARDYIDILLDLRSALH